MTNEEHTVEAARVENLRARAEYEDGLLNSRMGVILTINGLAGVATGLSEVPMVKLSVAILLIAINILWIPCGIESSSFIHALNVRIRESNTIPEEEQIRQTVRCRPFRIGPNRLMGVVAPSLVLVAWLVALAATVFCGGTP